MYSTNSVLYRYRYGNVLKLAVALLYGMHVQSSTKCFTALLAEVCAMFGLQVPPAHQLYASQTQ